MQLLTNAIDTESVRHETEDDTDYLVAPVVLVRSMWLNGPDPDGPEVYLPQTEIESSAERWEAIPGPINHPTHNGQPPEQGGRPISIHDERADAPVISEIRNPEPTVSNGETAIAGELWVNIEAAEQAGADGQRVITRLENGDAVEVSSGYAVGEIIAGQFDGEHREAAAINIQPDHVAILPASKGKCSIADGCGAGAPLAPVANELYVQTVAETAPSDEGGGGSVAGDESTPAGDTGSTADDEPDGSEDGGPVADPTADGAAADTADEPLDEGAIRRAYQALRDVVGGNRAGDDRDSGSDSPDGDPGRDTVGASSGDEPAELAAQVETLQEQQEQLTRLYEKYADEAG